MTRPCLFERIKGGSALRTDTVKGVFENWPKKGDRFILVADSLTPGGFARMITTSPVDSIKERKDDSVLFVTESGSEYRVTAIQELGGV
jgi:hypothetical protein